MSSDPDKHSKLESERFWMRTLTSEDVSEKYLAWLADDETVQWLNARYGANNEANVRAYVEQFDNINSFHLGIFVKNQNLHIGNFSISIDSLHDTAHVSVLVGDRDWWGKGKSCSRRVRLSSIGCSKSGTFTKFGFTVRAKRPGDF